MSSHEDQHRSPRDPSQPDTGFGGPSARPSLPRTDRHEAPLYLARYLERQSRGDESRQQASIGEVSARSGSSNGRQPTAADAVTNGSVEVARDDADPDTTPLYLRRFRERRVRTSITESVPPLWERSGHGIQKALSEDNRNKEISAPPAARPQIANEIYLVRHGETQGYSTESGLTPLGTWQAHTYGHTLAKRIKHGEKVILACAATNRASQTAQQIRRGLVDGLEMFEKDVEVLDPAPMQEFRNFGVVTPDGLRDVTGAFRQYYSLLEEFERTALGDRPMWLVEIDRFWRVQQGGADPIQHWLNIPMLHFEPPAMCVRRFWMGIQRLAEANPGARLAIATHSGPIRAFAVAALGYDPGEPYNTEHVRVKLMDGGREAFVSYRNRVQEVHVPDIGSLPTWGHDEHWVPTVEQSVTASSVRAEGS
jgi:broad specificity phosphatase PhoE